MIVALTVLFIIGASFSWGPAFLSFLAIIVVAGAALELGCLFKTEAASWARLCSALFIASPAVFHGVFLLAGARPASALALSLCLFAAGFWLAGRASLQEGTRFLRDEGVAFLLVGLGGYALISLINLRAIYMTGYYGMNQGANYGVLCLAWLVLVVASNDMAAYFGGSFFQGPKLAPALSPNKTISGSICGLGAALIVGGVCSFIIHRAVLEGITFGMISAVGAQLGDLLKSFLKRIYGVKDLGNIFPGHGGVLDRADGTLGAALLFSLLLG